MDGLGHGHFHIEGWLRSPDPPRHGSAN